NFKKRMRLSEKVAAEKFQRGDAVFKPEREEFVIENLTEGMEEPLKVEYTSFLKKVMEISRTRQYKKLIQQGKEFPVNFLEKCQPVSTVCYQGLEGSYSAKTAKMGFPDAKLHHVVSFEAVFSQVSQGNCEMGIVPLENTTAGNINEVYDLLLKYDLYINFIKISHICHCLLGLPEAKMKDIRTVYSHPQALSQCGEFIKHHHLEQHQATNTAVAAKFVSHQEDVSAAAIGSEEAAQLYGMKILAYEINHNKENATKFIAVSKNLIVEESFNKISIVFSCPHKSGSLASVLSIFSDYGVNLTEIHSRPDGKSPWKYLFYVDFPGNLKEKHIQALIFQLGEELPFIKILGNYQV
ncbi:MAG: prephenate dehydratase domain-containing protein, partial [Anaerovorax sp.]